MAEHDPLRRVAHYRVDRLLEEDRASADHAGDAPAGGAGVPASGADAAPRAPRPPSMTARGSFADELVRQAMARGEFDDLPLAGKPIPSLTGRYDPDWWLKAFIEREQITGVLPEALQLRKDDAVLDDRLDREPVEARVREMVAEFNARIVEARRQLLGGPPVVTPTRDVEAEVLRWHERRRVRLADAAARAAQEATTAERSSGGRRRALGWGRTLRRVGRRPAPDGNGTPPRDGRF